MGSLATTTPNQLLMFGQTLWSWRVCDQCKLPRSNLGCSTLECASHHYEHLARFFVYYRGLIGRYHQYTPFREMAAIGNHQDLLDIIRLLKENPSFSRAELTRKVFPEPSEKPIPSAVEQERAINLAVRIITMLNCTSSHDSAILREHGLDQPPWMLDTPFDQFVRDSFPGAKLQGVYSDSLTPEMRDAISARKLKKRAGLRFVPTDDLASHLKMDKLNRSLQIFHHCGFLKENLKVARNSTLSMNETESLKLGCIPPQLALEVLYTLQNIIFPLSDNKSYSLLNSLIATSSFDPTCRHLYIPDIPGYHPEEEMKYFYFGDRLQDLYDEVSDPGPQSWLGKQLERRKGARHVMMATLAGVVIAIVLGMLTLGVSGYQAWLGYQQWQHPIDNSP